MNIDAKVLGRSGNVGEYISILVLALLLAVFIHINIIAPISGDLWYCASEGGYTVSPTQLVNNYFHGFMKGNPRIGDVFLDIACQSQGWRVFIKVAGTVLFVIACFTVTFGRPILYSDLVDCTVILLLFSSIWTSNLASGRMLFYDPYFTNYVLDYAVLLIFLIPFRFVLSGRPLTHEPMLIFIMPVLGTLAGLTNEHTPPAYIALLFAALMLFIRRNVASKAHLTWLFGGWAGLVFGYTMLFFAPGQAIHYGGIKYQQFDLDIKTKIMTFVAEIHRVVGSSYFIVSFAGGSLLLILVAHLTKTISRFRLKLPKDIIYTIFFGTLTAFGMLATLVFSPIIDDRLYFASLVNLTMVGCAIIYQVAKASPVITMLLFGTGVAINAYYFAQARTAYLAFREQFQTRERAIVAQRTAGRTEIVIPNYENQLGQYGHFLRLDANDTKFYELLARYYGVQNIVERTDKRE